jgi:hypothetical protein
MPAFFIFVINMKPAILLALCISLAHTGRAQMKISQISPEQEKFYATAMAGSRPAIVNWIRGEAKKFQMKDIPDQVIRTDIAHAAGQLGKLQETDITALEFLVMIQVSKDSQSDLQSIAEEMAGINRKKDSLRKAQGEKNENQQASQASPYPAVRDSVKKVPPSLNRKPPLTASPESKLSDIESSQQLKLQLILDRRSKTEATASNLFKKIQASTAAIISNMK